MAPCGLYAFQKNMRSELAKIPRWYKSHTDNGRHHSLTLLVSHGILRLLGRLLIEAPFVSITHHQLSPPFCTGQSHHVRCSFHIYFPFQLCLHFQRCLETYNRKTKQNLASHPLLPRLQSCGSPEAILTVLHEQTPEFDQSQNSDDGLTKWVTPAVNVLYSFSATLGGVVGLVNIRIFPYHMVQSNIHLLGIPTSEHNFYGDWRSSPGPCLYAVLLYDLSILIP